MKVKRAYINYIRKTMIYNSGITNVILNKDTLHNNLHNRLFGR